MVSSETLTFGFVRSFAIGVPFWTIAEHGARRCADEHGAVLIVRHCIDESAMSVAILALIEQHVDVIIIGAMAPNHPDFLAALHATTNARIPVIALDMPLSYPVACQVHSDDVRGSVSGTTYLAERLGGKGSVVHLQGEMDSAAAQLRSTGVHTVLQRYPNIQIVAETDRSQWKRADARRLMYDIARIHTTIDGVIAANDQMALGAIDALTELGHYENSVVVGIDGDADALLALHAGTLAATVMRSPYQMGRTAVETALQLCRGDDVPPEVLLDDMRLVTRETVTQAAIESLQIMPGVIHDLMQTSAVVTTERTLLRTIIDSLPDFFYVKNREGRFEVANMALAQLLGVASPDTLIGLSDATLFPPALAAGYAIDEQKIFQTGMPLLNKEEPVTDADGNERWIVTTKVPLHDAQGQITRIVGRGQDITERRAAELERQRLHEELIHAQARTLEELSTPLIPITDTILVVPLIGRVDAQRASQLIETLLLGIQKHQADLAIIDITGIHMVDTYVANTLLQVAKAVKLLGAQVVLTGLRPEVAQTFVGFGVDLSGIMTHSTLQSGIGYALRQR